MGTFYYTSNTAKNGVETSDKVDATLITGVRVRFIPETRCTSSERVQSRSMVSDNIFWMELPEGVKGNPEPGGGEEERPGEL